MATSLQDIKGVGPALARLLTEAGFTDPVSVASADVEALVTIYGIGPHSAAAIRTDAQRLLGSSAATPSTGASQPGLQKKKKKKKKARSLRKQARQLRAQAQQLTKKAGSTKSKKKRKRRLREAAELENAAKRKRRKAEKLLSG